MNGSHVKPRVCGIAIGICRMKQGGGQERTKRTLGSEKLLETLVEKPKALSVFRLFSLLN